MAPKMAENLSALEVRRLQKAGLYAVGGVSGLCLQVSDTGARSWILRTISGGRRRSLGLGPFPEVSLALARAKAAEVKAAIREGRDPTLERKAARNALRASQAHTVTFQQAAQFCHAARAPEFRNRKHRAQWITTLRTYAFPTIGALPVDQVDLACVLSVLQPIWQTKTETATRVRSRIEAVLAWATVTGLRSGSNPALWRNNLDAVLPKPGKIRRVAHHRALPFKEVPAFMATLRQRHGMVARALEFAILTAARSGEVRGMTWAEVNLEARLWTVPAERIKAGKRHRVPLSDDAVRLLEALPRALTSDLVFWGARGGVMSGLSLSGLLQRMGVDAVPHGFRSSFKDWARSQNRYDDEVSELALAHVSTDATRAAYARDELLEQRAELMAAWARWCGVA